MVISSDRTFDTLPHGMLWLFTSLLTNPGCPCRPWSLPTDGSHQSVLTRPDALNRRPVSALALMDEFFAGGELIEGRLHLDVM